VITEFPAGAGSLPHDMIATPDGVWFTNAEYIGHVTVPERTP
jgi:streptogramin lyase